MREYRGELATDSEDGSDNGYGNQQSDQRIFNGGYTAIRVSQKLADPQPKS